MSQIITVTFAEGQREAIAAEPLEQWAYGQTLQFEGLDLPQAYRVDFSNFEYCGASIPRVGGPDGVAVPVEVLTSGRNVYAFIWVQDETSGARYRRATVRVVPGPEPDPEEPNPEESSAIAEAIAALNDAVDTATEQAEAAQAAAGTASGAADDAAAQAVLSESWAVGGTESREGEDQNNSKFWAMVAQQGAEHSGYAIFDVNDQDGQMYVTITDPLAQDVTFLVNENTGELEVTING